LQDVRLDRLLGFHRSFAFPLDVAADEFGGELPHGGPVVTRAPPESMPPVTAAQSRRSVRGRPAGRRPIAPVLHCVGIGSASLPAAIRVSVSAVRIRRRSAFGERVFHDRPGADGPTCRAGRMRLCVPVRSLAGGGHPQQRTTLASSSGRSGGDPDTPDHH